jgi:UDP-glucose 4-epimerase
MSKSKILLVGGNGYLGRHLANILSQSCDLFITGTKQSELPNYFTLDFDNKDSFSALAGHNFNLIIILASKITGIGSLNLSNEDIHTNAFAYARFLQFISENKLTDKIVYISSMTVYGADNSSPVHEEANIAPLSVYGLSKQLAENITSFYCNNTGIKGVTIRPPGIYGGDRNGGYIYNTIRKCQANEEITLSSKGLGYWESIEVNDLSTLIVDLLNSYTWSKQYDMFNVAYGEPTDFYKTAFLIKELTNSSSNIIIEGEKGYQEFYMSNQKLKELVDVTCSFKHSLHQYILKLEK